MSGFWRNWLNVWCVLVIVFGLVLAGGGLEVTSGGADMLFGMLGGPGDIMWTPHLRFSVALMGAVTMGWGLTFVAVFAAAHRLGNQAAMVWRLVSASVLAWFVIDSALSVATGFALNAVPNAALLVGYLVPVIANGVLKPAR
ncbi:MAG: hypothetical protein QM773_05940 [Hyphomonadaceae bacterium]